MGRKDWDLTPMGVRSAVLLVGGLLLLFHETVIAHTPRWELLSIAVAMMGVEVALRKDKGGG